MTKSAVVSHHVLDGRDSCLPNRPEVFSVLAGIGLEAGLEDRLFDVFDTLGCLGRERLLTPDTELLVIRRLLITARADDRRVVVSVGVLVDIATMERGVRALVRLLTEPSHIALRVLGAARATLAVLDARLAHPLEDEPARVGASEVLGCDVLREAGALSRLLEHLEVAVVGELRRFVEVRPQGIVRILARVVREPAVDKRDGDNEMDDSLAGLPIDVDAHCVLAVDDVSNAERLELAAAESGFELEHNRGRVTCIPTGVDHRFDLFVVSEEVALAGRWIVAARGSSRDPLETLWRFVTPGDALPEDADGTPVVPVGLLVVVRRVDPADDILGSVAIVDSVSETSDVLSHSRAVTEQLEMPIVGVLAREQLHLFAECDQCISILIGDVPGVVGIVDGSTNAISEAFDRLARVPVSHTFSTDQGTVNIMWTSPPWLYQICEQSHARYSDVGFDLPVEGSVVTPHSAISTHQGGVSA